MERIWKGHVFCVGNLRGWGEWELHSLHLWLCCMCTYSKSCLWDWEHSLQVGCCARGCFMSTAEKSARSGTEACKSRGLAQVAWWHQVSEEKTWAVTGGGARDRRSLIWLRETCVTFLSAKLAYKKWYFFCSYCWPCQTFAKKPFVKA